MPEKILQKNSDLVKFLQSCCFIKLHKRLRLTLAYYIILSCNSLLIDGCNFYCPNQAHIPASLIPLSQSSLIFNFWEAQLCQVGYQRSKEKCEWCFQPIEACLQAEFYRARFELSILVDFNKDGLWSVSGTEPGGENTPWIKTQQLRDFVMPDKELSSCC